MIDGTIRLVCPACGGPLEGGSVRSVDGPGGDADPPEGVEEGGRVCGGCGRRFAAPLGIVDLRQRRDAAEAARVDALLRAYRDADFETLLRIRSPAFSTSDPRLVARYERYRRDRDDRGRRFVRMAERRVEEVGASPDGVALDLGCGVGASAVVLAERFPRVIGVDPSLSDLILARKSLEEAKVTTVTLVAARAERLPIPDGTVGFVLAENVLEHLHQLDAALGEVGRVLVPGGTFAADSVNRYNLLRPEPHVGLWALGCLPRRWQASYARRRRGFEGYDRSVRLPSLRELRAALRGIRGRARVAFPDAEAYGFPAWAGRLLRGVERVPVVSSLLLWIFPAYLVLARRGP